MAAVIAEEELYRSCHIIFGKDLKVSNEFLQYLQLSGIKKAYRRKALEIHPDMGAIGNLSLQQNLAHQFIDVHHAYKTLLTYLEARDKGREPSLIKSPFNEGKRNGKAKSRSRNGTSTANTCTSTENTCTSTKNTGTSTENTCTSTKNTGTSTENTCTSTNKQFYREKAEIFRFSSNNGMQRKPPLHDAPLDPKCLYKGPVPNCQLLFGRYLYYTGIISLHTIGQALIWQRSQRPRLGEIGRQMGMLNQQDTLKILQSRQDRQLFGELALRLGLLTREQLHLILLHQKKLHKRIGQYFVAKNFWDTAILDEYISAHRRHNSRVQRLFA